MCKRHLWNPRTHASEWGNSYVLDANKCLRNCTAAHSGETPLCAPSFALCGPCCVLSSRNLVCNKWIQCNTLNTHTVTHIYYITANFIHHMNDVSFAQNHKRWQLNAKNHKYQLWPPFFVICVSRTAIYALAFVHQKKKIKIIIAFQTVIGENVGWALRVLPLLFVVTEFEKL